MTALDLSSPVAVVGTGTMGQGIAQVALVAGHPVRLYDTVPGRARDAAEAIGARLDRLVAKDRLTGADRDAARARLKPVDSLADLADCGLVVEAVLERLDVKRQLFGELEEIVAEDCLLATNTSSLSVTAIGGALRHPGRFVGLHFFNPAPLLPLVEVVSGFATDVTSATRAYETARAWGKTPVACADTPGFIVNRIARPFYAEAFAVYEAQAADPATIDAVLRECGGFKMGAFELTDLIGQDVNESVTHSVWQSFFQDVRFTPSLAQRRLVESGRLGRKSGRGWYDYAEGAERPEPHTADKEQPPAHVVAEGGLGPAGELLTLIREAGIQVREEDEDHGTRLVLPSGGQLVLADGQTSAEFRDVVYFDLAPGLPRGHPDRPVRRPGHLAADPRRGHRPVPGARQAGQRHRGRPRHDRRPHGRPDRRPRPRRRRQGRGHRGGHRHRDAPGRELPARPLRVGPQARPRVRLRRAGRDARARPLRTLRALPRALPPRLRHRQAGGHPYDHGQARHLHPGDAALGRRTGLQRARLRRHLHGAPVQGGRHLQIVDLPPRQRQGRSCCGGPSAALWTGCSPSWRRSTRARGGPPTGWSTSCAAWSRCS